MLLTVEGMRIILFLGLSEIVKVRVEIVFTGIWLQQ
jgi:hypothetical protein